MTDAHQSARHPVVETAGGAIRGTSAGGDGAVFAGIPFAAPPVGTRRLRPPEPAAAWAGVLDAATFPAGPAQRPGIAPDVEAMGPEAVAVAEALGAARGPFSEDCLYLNVWTPELGVRLPVLVWIYGGGFETGTASPPSFDGAALSRLTGAVVVAANYRVGALGWLYPAGPDADGWAESANLGLQDQVAALRWVRENAACFGGDPGNVTVAGASAGAFSIGALLAMPTAKGLFHKAILQSGSVTRVQSPETAEALTKAFLAAAGVRDFGSLLDAPVEAILQAQSAVTDADIGRRNLPGGRIWGVVHDGTILPERPLDAVRDGAAADVPLLIGANRDEIRIWADFGGPAYRPADEDALLAEMAVAGIADPPALLAAYRHRLRCAASAAVGSNPAGVDELRDLRTMFLSDAVYRIPSARLARAQAAAGGRANTYLLTAEPFGPGTGAFHGAEALYLAERLAALGIDTPENRAIRAELVGAWRRFVHAKDLGWPAHGPAEPQAARTRQIGGTVLDIDEPPLDVAAHWGIR
ncbi:carboxylesterase/lipase family protein [Yinghuangia soli]|uniref:Carboxylic ester hydrolase n=1 Tax=Yinghuangia soli TaxID=2908204 RepID=A0AA41U426_9ACTN|nr:carboxylesterase family protein [Yinghuangia soli]MCF2532440.1 carboxylesterase family protein [Yinghuangia soli]